MDNTTTRYIDPMIAIPHGNIARVRSVNKYGLNLDVDTAAAEDVWSGGGVWTPPTQARVHQIASTSADDAAAGTGLRTASVEGLRDWDSLAVEETVTLNGLTDVATGEFVAIYRIKPLTWGSAGPNVGTITATADVDGTVTARIEVGKGQTQMAVFAFSGLETLFMTQYYFHVLAGTPASTEVSLEILFNSIPNSELGGYLVSHDGFLNSGVNIFSDHRFKPFKRFPGPGIIKLQVSTSANNTGVLAGFDVISVLN